MAILSTTSAGFNRSRKLILPDCILGNWVFESFILADETFAKALRIFETYVSVKNCVLPSWTRIPVKLICCIALGSASSFCCLLKSIPISLKYFLK